MSFDIYQHYIPEDIASEIIKELKNYNLVNLSANLLLYVPFSLVLTYKIGLDFKETKLVESAVSGLQWCLTHDYHRRNEPNFLYELKKADKERDLLVDFRYKSGIRRLYAKKILEYIRTL
jgi:hypothetical protein